MATILAVNCLCCLEKGFCIALLPARLCRVPPLPPPLPPFPPPPARLVGSSKVSCMSTMLSFMDGFILKPPDRDSFDESSSLGEKWEKIKCWKWPDELKQCMYACLIKSLIFTFCTVPMMRSGWCFPGLAVRRGRHREAGLFQCRCHWTWWRSESCRRAAGRWETRPAQSLPAPGSGRTAPWRSWSGTTWTALALRTVQQSSLTCDSESTTTARWTHTCQTLGVCVCVCTLQSIAELLLQLCLIS